MGKSFIQGIKRKKNPLQQVNNGGFDFKTITEDKIEISTRIANNYKNDMGILGILVGLYNKR